jgi:dihydroorotate dehydrogenase (NAD+) catalytic subunit
VLLHTGLHNPGVNAIIKHHHRRWARCPCPVIAHVAGVNVGEAVECVGRLSDVDVVAGIELGLPDSLPIEEALEVVLAAQQTSLLPLIVKLPFWRAPELAAQLVETKAADALTVAAPPRGTVWHHGRPITGRLYSPATFPQALWMLRQIAVLVGGAIPLIGCGGVHSEQDARMMLEAGAVAVQVDSFIWKDPAAFMDMAGALL